MQQFTQIITDCDKSPKLGWDGITAAELDKWCAKNGCKWFGSDDGGAYVTLDFGSEEISLDETR